MTPPIASTADAITSGTGFIIDPLRGRTDDEKKERLQMEAPAGISRLGSIRQMMERIHETLTQKSVSIQTLLLWLLSITTTICGSLLVVTWFFLQGQIADLKERGNDIRSEFRAGQAALSADVRVIQKDASDLRLSVQKLDSRFEGLVGNLNEQFKIFYERDRDNASARGNR